MLSEESKKALEARYYPNVQDVVFGRFEAQLAARMHDGFRVLDAGSGPGTWILQPHRKRLKLLMGADVYVPEATQLDAFVLARCEQLPFAWGSFDMVVAYLVLEHLARPRLAFREFARVLRPGGYLVFKTPAVATPLFLLARVLPTALHRRMKAPIGAAEADVFPTYYRANTLGRLRRDLAWAGFERDWLALADQTYAYLAHSRWTYALGLFYSRLTGLPGLGWLRNQIIGIYRRAEDAP